MSEELRPAHAVIVDELEYLADRIERDVQREAMDNAFAKYSRLDALLCVLEQMVIPDAALQSVIETLAELSTRLAEALPTAKVVPLRVDSAGARLMKRVVVAREATAVKAADVAPLEFGADSIEEEDPHNDGF